MTARQERPMAHEHTPTEAYVRACLMAQLDWERERERDGRRRTPERGREVISEADRLVTRVKAEAAVEALKRLEFECESAALSIGGHNLNGAMALRDTARTVSAFRARIEKEAEL